MTYPYYFVWGNNEKRATMKGRRCAVVCRGAKNSCMIEFENGQQEIVSRNAIRKWKGDSHGRESLHDRVESA